MSLAANEDVVDRNYIHLMSFLKNFKHDISFHLAFQICGSVHYYGKNYGTYFFITEFLHWFIFPLFHIMLQPDTWWQKRVKTGKMKAKVVVLSSTTTFFPITECSWPITFLLGLILGIYHLKLLGETRCPQRWTAFPDTSNRAAPIRNLCLFSEHTSENIFYNVPSSLLHDLTFLNKVKLLSQDKFLTRTDGSGFWFFMDLLYPSSTLK